jgi:aminoglycoside 2'-N-acetyltransferase I
MRIDVRRADELSAEEQTALRTLSAAVYPADAATAWPGRLIEWASPQWCVVWWDVDGRALSHVGALVRDGSANGKAVQIGGIGGVKTRPQTRRRGLASKAIHRAIELFRSQGVDFAFLVCEPALVPLYERIGWKPHRGGLLVRQHGQTVPFSFNLPMTYPVQNADVPDGVIDLMGPPW